MRAMVFREVGTPLALEERELPRPGPHELLLRVEACGVCRTDLHVVDGDLPPRRRAVVPGHQVVGIVEAVGEAVSRVLEGARVGVPWLGGTCGHCEFCRTQRENLCSEAVFTGYHRDGGFAEACIADSRYSFPIPAGYAPVQAAPLLCAGLIGYRALRKAGPGRRLGFFGFGAAAHLLVQVARHQGREVYAFTRPGDREAQEFALRLGAAWAGSSGDSPGALLDAAILFAPVGELVPEALRRVKRGGRVVCAGIHMSDIPSFPYDLLWGEREICSVANLTRRDGEEFFALAVQIPVETEVHPYALEHANQALDDLRHGRFQGAAVVVPGREIRG